MQAAPTSTSRRSTATARVSPATAAAAKASIAARSTRAGATSPEAVRRSGPARRASGPRRSLAAHRPAALDDGDGRRPRAGGIPVARGVAAVVGTSGTTGERKGVGLTFAGLAASGAAVAAAVGTRPGDGWLCCLPIHLVAGLAVVGRAWTTGAALVVHPGFDPLAVADPGPRP